MLAYMAYHQQNEAAWARLRRRPIGYCSRIDDEAKEPPEEATSCPIAEVVKRD